MKEETRAGAYGAVLARMIQAETISVEETAGGEKFLRFHDLLRELFPKVFAVCEVEVICDSLLMHWRGKGEGEPILLMSHHDVVSAEGEWKYPPFSGIIAEGKLWGRGTVDTKGNLWAILTAAEELMAEGFVPERDVWFVSSCSEEAGHAAADDISAELAARGLRFYFTMDEGGVITHDPIGGADADFAVIGLGEKIYADLKFIARSRGGHASTPGKNTPLVRLGKFMAAQEKAGLFPAKMSPATVEMFSRFGRKMKGISGFLMRHAGTFKGLLCLLLPKISDAAGAMLKTTLAFTMAEGSPGLNVLPEAAYVTGNMRIAHHQGRQASIEAVKKLAEKFDIETEVLDPGYESPISDWRKEPFRFMEEAVKEIFPEVIPVPYVMNCASDSRFFSRVSDQCIRFAPLRLNEQQIGSIHGIDENIDIDVLPGAVDFYRYVIKNA